MEEIIKQNNEDVNRDDTIETYKKPYHWLEAYHFKKGNKMSTGRPKGSKSMKAYAKEMLEDMEPEERIEFLKKIDESIVWQMAEGRPEAKVEVTTQETPYDTLTTEEKRNRLQRALEELGEGEKQEGSDILHGGNTEISKDGQDTQGSGSIPQICTEECKKSSDTSTEKSPENNNNNNIVGNTATDNQSKPEDIHN